MKERAVVSALFMVFLVAVVGCASLESGAHKYLMRGQILEIADDTAYLCVGSKDGAKAGQEYMVYRFVRAPNPSPKAVQPYYKREQIGKVRVTEIVDEHMATAKVLAGHVKENDVVELEQ